MLGCDTATRGREHPRRVGATSSKGEARVSLAYLDPGSGSLIASVLVGGVAAAGVAAKQARARLGGLGRKRKHPVEPTVTDAETATEDATAGVESGPEPGTPADEPTTVSSDT
jgi:hypothetical protein